MKEAASLIIVIIMAVELYLVAAGSNHRKKKPEKGANVVKATILSITKKKDAMYDGKINELEVELPDKTSVKVKSGSAYFNVYQIGEEVELQEKNGFYKFLGNDRVAKRSKAELAAGLIPVGILILVNVLITILTQ